MSSFEVAGKAFLDALFGKANYCRWLSLKADLQIDTDEVFVCWLLDAADTILIETRNRANSEEEAPSNRSNNDEDEFDIDQKPDCNIQLINDGGSIAASECELENNSFSNGNISKNKCKNPITLYSKEQKERKKTYNSGIEVEEIDNKPLETVQSETLSTTTADNIADKSAMDQRQFTANAAAKFFYNSAAAAASMQACGTFNLPQSHDMMYSPLTLPPAVARTVNNSGSPSSQQMQNFNQQNSFLPHAHTAATSPFSGVSQSQIMHQFPQASFSYGAPTTGMLGGAFSSFLPQQSMSGQDMSLHQQLQQHQHQATAVSHLQAAPSQLSPNESSSTTSSPGVAVTIDSHHAVTAPPLLSGADAAINASVAMGSCNALVQPQPPPPPPQQQHATTVLAGCSGMSDAGSGTGGPTARVGGTMRRGGGGTNASMNTGASGNGDKYQCHICSKSFCHKNYLTIHIRKHTGERPFACPYCQRRFSIKDYLQKHLRTHTGEKPYACHICSRRFGQKSALNTHVRIHTGEKPYFCNICQMKFTQRTSLKNHAKVRHPDQAQNI